MEPTLPLKIKAQDATAARLHLQGDEAVERLPRLAEALAGDAGALHADLRFAPSLTSRGVVMGHLHGQLRLRCQRCLQAFDWSLDIPLHWQLVQSEAEEERLMAEAGEPVWLEDGWLLLREAVQDEALLALPIAPVCAEAACAGRYQAELSGKGAGDVKIGHNAGLDEPKPNPFAALKGQFPAKKGR